MFGNNDMSVSCLSGFSYGVNCILCVEETNDHYNKSKEKKNFMFRNILNLQKRHNTLSNIRQSDPVNRKIARSNENLKFSQINVPNPKRDEAKATKNDQKLKRDRLTSLKRDSIANVIVGAKEVTKLQITPSYKRITLSSTNSLGNQIDNQIRQKIEKDIVPSVVQTSLSSNITSNSFTYSTVDFAKILHQIFCLFLEEEEQEQDKSFLNKALQSIKRLVLEANKNAMVKKHQIAAVNSLKINQGSVKVTHQMVSEERLDSKRQILVLEIEALTRKIQELKQQRKDVEEDLIPKETRLATITQKTNEILTYVQSQNRNKIIKVAGKHFHTIEADIKDYVVTLQNNKKATSVTYEPVIQYIQQSLKQMKRQFLQNSKLSLEEKFNTMRDFVRRLREKYQKKEAEQQKIIQLKTRYIVTFVEKMKKWVDNWTLKQDYLVNLRSQFSVDSETFESTFNAAFPSQTTKVKELFDTYLKLKENYLLGNSFY